MEHNLPAYYWQWSSPAASTAGCEDSRLANTDLTPISKLSKCKQTTGCFALQGGLPISFLWKAFTDFYNLVCAHRGTNLPCNVLLIHKDGFGCTGATLFTLKQSLWKRSSQNLCSAQRGESIAAGLGISTAAEISSSLPTIPLPTSTSQCSGQIQPLAFCFQLILFLVPWITAIKKKCPNLNWNLSPPWQPLQSSWSRWWHVWGVWFWTHHRPGFKCKSFNRVKFTVPKSLGMLPDRLSVFWALLFWRGVHCPADSSLGLTEHSDTLSCYT